MTGRWRRRGRRRRWRSRLQVFRGGVPLRPLWQEEEEEEEEEASSNFLICPRCSHLKTWWIFLEPLAPGVPSSCILVLPEEYRILGWHRILGCWVFLWIIFHTSVLWPLELSTRRWTSDLRSILCYLRITGNFGILGEITSGKCRCILHYLLACGYTLMRQSTERSHNFTPFQREDGLGEPLFSPGKLDITSTCLLYLALTSKSSCDSLRWQLEEFQHFLREGELRSEARVGALIRRCGQGLR